ncbi:hypothetical protein E1301_Tti022809 [Triplophysa tibetana]|uniref:Uncharacterized protein n=1 Tax=Triplophysa tibetana TaxID=1572043 RepID=A0A5A9ND63_9TELE|nr:hypothetical protein E1301_Tti022809 [Triplophysa tibetana]
MKYLKRDDQSNVETDGDSQIYKKRPRKRSSRFEKSTLDMEQVVQMTEWLKYNIWPPSQVEQYMKEKAIHRAKWIRDDGTKAVMEIVKEYPRPLDTPDMKKRKEKKYSSFLQVKRLSNLGSLL